MSKVDKIVNGMFDADLPSNYWDTSDVEFPELEASQLVIQRNDQSVYEHTMAVIDLLTIKNQITLLSGLFHDLGKGIVVPMDDPNLPRFPGHAEESARIAEDKLQEWGANRYLIDRVVRLVATHMYDISGSAREKSIRKFVADVRHDNIDNWFALRIADSRSYAAQRKYRSHFIEPFRMAILSYLAAQPGTDLPQFPKSGPVGKIQIEGGEIS